MIGPVARRVASSRSTMKTTPSTTSSCQRQGRAVGEVLAALDRVGDDGDRRRRGHHVPQADAVAVATREWKQQERQHQHEGDVGVAQILRGDDRCEAERPGSGDGHVQVEQRRRDRDRGNGRAGPSGQTIGRPLFLLDERLGLASGFGGHARFSRRGCRVALYAHAVPFPSGSPLRLVGEASTPPPAARSCATRPLPAGERPRRVQLIFTPCSVRYLMAPG